MERMRKRNMSRYIKLSISLSLIMTLNSFAKTNIYEIASLLSASTSVASQAIETTADQDSGNTKPYILNPVDTSLPTVNDTGDYMSYELETWLAFDLSKIPKNATIVSATLSAYMWNMADTPSQRYLGYYSDDSWISIADEALSDPGNDIMPDQIVCEFTHDDPSGSGYVWKTIPITYDGWANDIADGYISLVLVGGQYGAVGLSEASAFGIDSKPELTLTVVEGASNNKVYTNIFNLGPEELVKADNLAIDAGDYSVPSLADWNNDGLKDLIVGSTVDSTTGKVRIYLNNGTNSEPNFSEYFYAKSGNNDLTCSASGCLGCFPRVVYWNADSKKDLLIGQSDGSVKLFLNTNTDKDPKFDIGTLLSYTHDGYIEYIDIGSRATPGFVDWNNDKKRDLVVGALDGKINIFLNEGTDTVPLFTKLIYAIDKGITLSVPTGRSCPVIMDLNFDGKKDILTGNTEGQLLFYVNTGTDKEPEFSGYTAVASDNIAIDYTGQPRSRPFVGYWDQDGYPDVLIGAYDGNIHLYRCKTLPADFDKDGDIDFTDWAIFSSYWGKVKYADKKAADLNGDGKVDIDDASWIAANWLLNIK
jgi:hypothetical protein